METGSEDSDRSERLKGDDSVSQDAQSVDAVAEAPQRRAAARFPISARHSGFAQILGVRLRVRGGVNVSPHTSHVIASGRLVLRVPSLWSDLTWHGWQRI
jgi:hypothetical protein